MFSILFQRKLKGISKQKVVLYRNTKSLILKMLHQKILIFRKFLLSFVSENKLVEWDIPGKFQSWQICIFSSGSVLIKKYCPLLLVHNFLNQMPSFHFPSNISILKADVQLSSGGRQPSAGQTSKYHYTQTQDGPSCTTSYRHYIDSMGVTQLQPEFKITQQLFSNASSLKIFHILKLGR